MSLESALDEERRDVMDILEGRVLQPRDSTASTATPLGPRNASPVPIVRSMLDIGVPLETRRGSSTSIGSGSRITSPLEIRSMLDIKGSGMTHGRITHSLTTSATASKPSVDSLHRAQSEAASHPPDGRPRAQSDRGREAVDLNAEYQFSMLPSIKSQALPKRVTQGGKKQGSNVNSMVSIMQGQELGPMPRGRDSGRHNSTAGIPGGTSKSPSSRLNYRPQSPEGSVLNTSSSNPIPTPGRFLTDAGKVIDMSNAYRRLSDAALLQSGGGLSTLPAKPRSELVPAGSGQMLSPTGEIRLQKDYYENDENDEAAIETSDEDSHSGSSGNEGRGKQKSRGRQPSKQKKSIKGRDEAGKSTSIGMLGMGRVGGPRKVKSLMAAAEEERLKVSSQYKVKSMLDPIVTVTPPNGEKGPFKKVRVHPNTNYDQPISSRASPVTSDSDEINDIIRAQRLGINMSPVDSTPPRAIRTMIRGEFSKMQQEAEEGSRRIRSFLVATDLSGEAAYALEWTIGTVLRDGDTLLAVYCVDEETGTGKLGEADNAHGIPIGEGGRAMLETAAIVGKLTVAAQKNASTPSPSPLGASAFRGSRGGSTDSRSLSRTEQERYHAIEDITQTCIRLLRKTKLQVRIAIEVIHCKSPKYMITEAIDTLRPTLVVLGSRGRSALKGVLLGSFSNYLVTKSSIPVMVVRKKLQKSNSKSKLPRVRLPNNLTLADAKID